MKKPVSPPPRYDDVYWEGTKKLDEVASSIDEALENFDIERSNSKWSRLHITPCDLCEKPAAWGHPEGGFRCETCPRPESLKP